MWKPAIFLALLLPSACSPLPADAALEPLATATLTPGVGLGEARIGETTLATFVDHFGAGRTDLIASDELALELVFRDGELSFLFLLGDASRSEAAHADVFRAARDLPGFIQAHPTLGEIPLHSISVAAGATPLDSFFQGQLSTGGALFDIDQSVVLNLGIPSRAPRPMMAGLSPDNPEKAFYYPELGLLLYAEALGHFRGVDSREMNYRVTRMTVLPASSI